MVQTKMQIRVLGTIALIAMLASSLSGCSAVKQTVPAWKTAVSQGTDNVIALGDDFSTATVPGRFTQVDDLATAVDDAPIQGLSTTEAAMIARAEALVSFWTEVKAVFSTADEVAGLIPDEAVALASLRLSPNSNPAFVKHVDDLAVRTLKGLACNTAKEMLSSDETDAVAGETLTYDPAVGLTSESVLAYLGAGLSELGYDLEAVDEVFAA